MVNLHHLFLCAVSTTAGLNLELFATCLYAKQTGGHICMVNSVPQIFLNTSTEENIFDIFLHMFLIYMKLLIFLMY